MEIKTKQIMKHNFLFNKNEMLVDKVIFFGLLGSLVLVPLILRGSFIDFISPSFTGIPSYSTGEKFEIFSYNKYLFLIFITIILSLIFIIKVFVFNYSIKKSSVNLLIGLFIVVVLLSSMFATHKFLALRGIFDRNEGTITYLCYAILFFIASNIKIPKNYLKWTLYILIPFTIVNSIIGLLNFYGTNLLKNKVVLHMIIGNLGDEFTFSEGSYLMGTLDQGNYLSGVSAMLFITFFILATLCKNLKLKIINIILLFLSFSILLASLSNSGFFTISLLVPLFLVLLFFNKKYKEIVLGFSLVLSLTIVFIPMNNHNEKVWNETFGNYQSLNPFFNKNSDIKAKEKSSEPSTDQNKAGSNVISPKQQVENFIPQLPEAGISWGSGRGYLWKTTLPLIYERPILGYGLDTYTYHFPQNDINMISGVGAIAVATKPHSLYLDLAFGTGVLGLLIFLIMIAFPFGKSVKRIILNKNLNEDVEILAITFILFAYLIQGIVNDSIIGVSVIFYILLGVLTSELYNKEEKVA